MATTIDRSLITPTNDTGTPATPNGDGTLWNAAYVAAIYDEIDQLFNGTTADPFVFGGKLKVEGFGTHEFTASGTGNQLLAVRNTSAGTTNLAALDVGNNNRQDALRIAHYSTTYTTSGAAVQDGASILANRPGGLSVGAVDAAGAVRFYSGATERARIDSSGRVGIGATPAASGMTFAVGAIASGSAIGAHSANHLVVAGGGSSPQAGMISWGDNSGWNLDFGTRDGSGNFLVRQRFVATGAAQFSDGTAAAPSAAFISDTNTGLYSPAADYVGVAGGGIQIGQFARKTNIEWLIPQSANGTGTSIGNGLLVRHNTSGNAAAGWLALENKNGTIYYLWVDATGDLRIHTAAPTEDSTTVSDTAGTVVGVQS